MSSPPVPSVREAIAEGGASARCVAAFRFLIARLHGEHAAASWAGDDERAALWGIDAERHGGAALASSSTSRARTRMPARATAVLARWRVRM